MTKILDNFNGYLNIDNDIFSYNTANHIVTLLPTQVESRKRYEVLDRVRSRNIDSHEYLFGIVDNNFEIAMLRNGKFGIDSLGLSPSIQFGTPVIIKSVGNSANFHNMLTAEWNYFHSITFYGGNINALYNPRIAIEPLKRGEYKKSVNDGTREIKIRPWEDYTRSVDLDIGGEKATLTISVLQSGDTNNSKNVMSYNLGKLDSYLCFSFENPQCFDKIVKYYQIIKSLVAILTMRNNVFFEVYLSQRNSYNQYFQTAICKIVDPYENHSKRKDGNVIPLYKVFDRIPALIEKIVNSEVEPFLTLLPDDNKKADQISITNVQDLCTALEIVYDWSKRHQEQNRLIEELKKQIKKTITDFASTHKEIDVYTETTIRSAFKYLDYTLKQKIITLYNEHCDAVNAVVSKWSLPQVNDDNISSFVKLRNNKTHAGTIEWGENSNLYITLLALGYACLFKHIGLSDEVIKFALTQIF